MHIKIEDINVAISHETVDAFLTHKEFCSIGLDWISRHDPFGQKEIELIENVIECFHKDFLNSICNFDENLYDEYQEIFSDLYVDDYWDELHDLIESVQLSN